jgi:hypothetical protein
VARVVLTCIVLGRSQQAERQQSARGRSSGVSLQDSTAPSFSSRKPSAATNTPSPGAAPRYRCCSVRWTLQHGSASSPCSSSLDPGPEGLTTADWHTASLLHLFRRPHDAAALLWACAEAGRQPSRPGSRAASTGGLVTYWASLSAPASCVP